MDTPNWVRCAFSTVSLLTLTSDNDFHTTAIRTLLRFPHHGYWDSSAKSVFPADRVRCFPPANRVTWYANPSKGGTLIQLFEPTADEPAQWPHI